MMKPLTVISMYEITQFTEEQHWGRRSQKDRRSTEDKPDAYNADVTFHYYSFTKQHIHTYTPDLVSQITRAQ